MRPSPTDKKLYDAVKKSVYRRWPVHSAFRSGRLVSEYKRRFAQKHKGTRKRPYTSGKKRPLRRWFREKWSSDTGKTRYTSKSSVFRPTVRVSKKTPRLLQDLSAKELKSAKREKARTGRVKRF